MKFFEMKRDTGSPWFLCALCVLWGSVLPSFALDREAFTITNYDLNVRVEPEQHRLGVRGKITLRNDSALPQKIAALQISSSLDWRSIKTGDKAVQFVAQPFTSDIDHTGALSEAIVTLPQPVAPKGTVELEIGYEGVILLDATRLTRIGTPENVAKSTDWDQIGSDFTGVRGAGYVAWYPISTEAANLSEGDMFEVLGRWKTREMGSTMHLGIELAQMNETGLRTSLDENSSVRLNGHEPEVLFNGIGCARRQRRYPGNSLLDCDAQPLRFDAWSLLIAGYEVLERPALEVHFVTGHNASAASYADEAEKPVPFITEWFGAPRERARTAELPDPDAAPFESGSLLLTPFVNDDSKLGALAAAHQFTHAAFPSARPWIDEGLAHFAQALYVEHEMGRQSALAYMGLHRFAFVEAEKPTTPADSEADVNRALVNTTSDEFYRSKAMYVWWMLRDMVGDAALKKALAAYRSEDDKDPAYMQHLIAAQTQRDLQWFFDDWVYHDRGLPDFKVDSVFSRQTVTGGYMVTVTIQNLGLVGAEVPFTVRSAEWGDVSKRIEVHAKSKASIRVEISFKPQEIVVNDGSVPESDTTNNVFKIEGAAK